MNSYLHMKFRSNGMPLRDKEYSIIEIFDRLLIKYGDFNIDTSYSSQSRNRIYFEAYNSDYNGFQCYVAKIDGNFDITHFYNYLVNFRDVRKRNLIIDKLLQ